MTAAEEASLPMSNIDYVAHSGIRCPFCGSQDIEGQEINIEERFAFQEIGCWTCDKSWTDVYQLTGYNPT